jgi:predicted XRE-type DNA-binding protein
MNATKKLTVPATGPDGEEGFVETSLADWLDLTPAQDAMIRTQVALTVALRERRKAAGVTQAELADRIGSSQSRVAVMKNGAARSSIDLLLRALFALGPGPSEIAAILAREDDSAAIPATKQAVCLPSHGDPQLIFE